MVIFQKTLSYFKHVNLNENPAWDGLCFGHVSHPDCTVSAYFGSIDPSRSLPSSEQCKCKLSTRYKLPTPSPSGTPVVEAL